MLLLSPLFRLPPHKLPIQIRTGQPLPDDFVIEEKFQLQYKVKVKIICPSPPPQAPTALSSIVIYMQEFVLRLLL